MDVGAFGRSLGLDEVTSTGPLWWDIRRESERWQSVPPAHAEDRPCEDTGRRQQCASLMLPDLEPHLLAPCSWTPRLQNWRTMPVVKPSGYGILLWRPEVTKTSTSISSSNMLNWNWLHMCINSSGVENVF